MTARFPSSRSFQAGFLPPANSGPVPANKARDRPSFHAVRLETGVPGAPLPTAPPLAYRRPRVPRGGAPRARRAAGRQRRTGRRASCNRQESVPMSLESHQRSRTGAHPLNATGLAAARPAALPRSRSFPTSAISTTTSSPSAPIPWRPGSGRLLQPSRGRQCRKQERGGRVRECASVMTYCATRSHSANPCGVLHCVPATPRNATPLARLAPGPAAAVAQSLRSLRPHQVRACSRRRHSGRRGCAASA